MIQGGVITKRIVIGDNFDDYMRRAVITGTATISNPSTGVMQVVSSNADAAYLPVKVYLPRGSYLKVTCQARQDDANKSGRISIHQQANDDTVGGNAVDWIEPDSRDWKPYTLTWPADPDNPFATVLFGQWLSGSGKTSYKDMVVTVYNGNAQQPEVRGCVLRNPPSGAWYIDDVLNAYASFGITGIAVQSDRLEIQMTPMNSWAKPIVVAQMSHTDSGKLYKVHLEIPSKSQINLYFYWDDGRAQAADPISPGTMGPCSIHVIGLA